MGGHKAAIWCLDWSPSVLEITSGSGDGTIRCWNPDTGRQIAPLIETGHDQVYAVKYSPQGDKFTSSGEDKVIRVWSKNNELLIQIKGHDYDVTSLCWSKDGVHIFSASYDSTIRKWRSIDGKELVLFRGHTRGIRSLCLSPDEHHLVSASTDCSVRIWDLTTNQSVGHLLLHDDELWDLAIFPDGKYIASAGSDAKVYIWSLEAALQQQGDDDNAGERNAKLDAKLKRCAGQSRDMFDTRLVCKRQPNDRGSAKYVKDFWDTDTNPAPRRAAPPESPSSPLHWRNFLGSLRFSTRPANAPESIPHQHRRWNFGLFPVGSPTRAVDVAPCREEDRYGITPETDAEAAAAMQRTSSNEADSSTRQGQPAPGTQGSEGPTETQGSSGGMREVSCEVKCCGLFFSCGRPTSHQS